MSNYFSSVNLATGYSFSYCLDFEINGVIPFLLERYWHSDSRFKGCFGHGWYSFLDMKLKIDVKNQNIGFLTCDGTSVSFPYFNSPDDKYYNRSEQLEAQCTPEGKYRIWNEKEQLYYYFTEQPYDGVNPIATIVNKNGFAIKFAYTPQGYLQQITDSAHRTLTITNDEQGRITQITAPQPTQNGRFTIATYAYSEEGDLIEQTNAEGDSMHFVYQNHLMVKETWRNGLNWFFKYDGDKTGARCIHTWGDDDIYNHKLELFDGLTKVTNSLNQVTHYYHKNGLVYHRIDANQAEHHWHYNQFNELLSYTDPERHYQLYDYNERGHLIQDTDADGATLLIDYDDYEQPYLPTTIQDVLGGKWTRNYDSQGNLIKSKNPLQAESKITWQDGLPQQITDALGNTTHLDYDHHYNLTRITSPTGAITHFAYDKLGRNTKVTNAKGAEQHLHYDLLGRVTAVDDFDGNHIQLSYDGIDNLLTYQDSHQKVHYTYSGMWKLRSRSDARGTTTFYYNTEEQLTMLENEKRIPYRFKLNEVGEVVEEIGFDQERTQYVRDRAGRVVQKTDAMQRHTRYQYTRGGQVSHITYHGGEEHRFLYNKAGQLLYAENTEAEVEFERNILGQITQERVNNEVVNSTYNQLGQRTKLASSLGADVDYQMNGLGQLEQITSQLWTANYQYDKFGFEVERNVGELSFQNEYDEIGRLVNQHTKGGNKTLHKRQYRWGVNDRLQKIIDSVTGETNFKYTPTGHLEYAKYGNGEEQFRKADNTGNIYGADKGKIEFERTSNQLIKKDGWNYKYDALGNLVEKYRGNRFIKEKQHQFTWNNAGMLIKAETPRYTVEFSYDALGRRLSKKAVHKHLSKRYKINYIWDGNVLLHEWYNHAPDKLTTYVYDGGSFTPTAKLFDGEQFSIATDQLGTPTHMYNSEGKQVWFTALDMNGAVREVRGNETDLNFRYQGQYYDVETGLSYNRFRYFESSIGRYISQDPIGLMSGEFGFYNYVYNPNGWLDVFGLDTVYGRLRDAKTKGDLKPYVGSAKNGIKKRYTKAELKGKDGKDHFTTPDHDTTRGLEQIIFERGKEKKGDDYWDNINNPVSPSHEGGAVYKDNMDKYTYRKTKAKEFMQKKYGDNWESKIDEAFGF